MTDKYISVTEFEKYLKENIDRHEGCTNTTYKKMTDMFYDGVCACREALLDFPTVDVQPNRWISVKDRLPDKFDYVLCYCKTTTGEGNEFMFGAYHNDTWWLKTCRTYATLEQLQMRVMYWMPLPEPPRVGE